MKDCSDQNLVSRTSFDPHWPILIIDRDHGVLADLEMQVFTRDAGAKCYAGEHHNC